MHLARRRRRRLQLLDALVRGLPLPRRHGCLILGACQLAGQLGDVGAQVGGGARLAAGVHQQVLQLALRGAQGQDLLLGAGGGRGRGGRKSSSARAIGLPRRRLVQAAGSPTVPPAVRPLRLTSLATDTSFSSDSA